MDICRDVFQRSLISPKVLRNHDVVSKDGDLVSLRVKNLTFEQKAKIKMICEKKMQEFIVKRGLSIWDYRLLDKDPVPDSLYYRVMKESGGRCALCGATKQDSTSAQTAVHLPVRQFSMPTYI